jgi:hypothetical protein
MLYAIAMFSCWWKDQRPASTHHLRESGGPAALKSEEVRA